MCYQSHGNGMCGIMVWHNVYVRLLTFNLSLHFSVAMVPVVDVLSTSPSTVMEYGNLPELTSLNC